MIASAFAACVIGGFLCLSWFKFLRSFVGDEFARNCLVESLGQSLRRMMFMRFQRECVKAAITIDADAACRVGQPPIAVSPISGRGALR